MLTKCQAGVIDMNTEHSQSAYEYRLQAAIDAVDIGLWDWDLVSGRITWLGHHERLFGFAPGEFDGTYASFEKRIHPDDLEELNRVVEHARQEKSEYTHEYRVVWPDGSMHWIAGRGRFVYNETGQPVRMYGAVLDITERKQSDAALMEANQRLSMLLQNAPLAITVMDSKALVQTWNPAAERLFGWSADEVLGRPIPIIPKEERQGFDELLADELKGEVRSGLEIRRLRKDGSRVNVSLWTAPLHNAHSEIIGMLGMFVDLTARKSYEATLNSLLQISENLHRNLETDKLLEALIIEAMKLTDSQLGWVGLPTEQGMILVRHISQDFEVVPLEYTWPPGVGWPGWVLVHKVPYISNDAGSDHVIVPEIREQFGVKSGIDTPILDAEGDILGFFEVNNKANGGGYNEHHVELLLAVSRIASVALQNAASYQNLQRTERELANRVEQQAVVTRLGRLALTGAEPQELFHQAVVMVASTLGVEYCKILELLPDGGALKLVAGVGWKEGLVGHATVSTGHDSQAGFTLLMKKPVIVEDFGKETRFSAPPLLRDHGVISGISVIIGDHHHPFGVMGAHTIRRRAFARDDVNFLQSIANVLAEAIQRKRAEEELRLHAARMAAVAEISRTFAEAGLDYQGILNTVARRTAEWIGDSCVITLFSDHNQRAFPVAFHHSDSKALALMEEALLHIWQGGTDTERFQALLAGESIYIPVVDPEAYRAQSEPEFWHYVDTIGVASVLIVPLKAQGRVIGTLGITRDHQGEPYARDDQVLLQNIADRAAMSIQNARLFEQVQGAREQLEALSRRLLEVQEAERRALAIELHDRVGQNLTGLSINLQNMKALLPDETAKTVAKKFDDAQALVEDTTRQIRGIMAELYPPELEDYGLAVALETYAERAASRGGVDLITDLPDLTPPPLSADVRIAVFRAAQEAINNALKHARATQLEVSLETLDGRIRLRVEDNGQGFEPGALPQKEAQTWGLKIMRERIESIGGTLQIESEPGAGTRVTFEIESRS
jgi:PAS domain S-box-containing protein